MMVEQPNILVLFVHSVPHVNVTLHRVNSTFDPKSIIYVESLGILASIPAAILILFLIGLLLYLLTRCCDRKSRKTDSQTCQKFTLISTTLFCCAAIGLGLYGNDDFHNGMQQALTSGRQIESLVLNFTNKTDQLKRDIRHKVLEQDLEEFERPTFNQTALKMLLDNVRSLQESTAQSVNSLEKILYLITNVRQDSIGHYLGPAELFEKIRWPSTIGFLAFLLLLCFILVVGVCRSSRCTLILFSVIGLFCVIICWLLSGIYLSTTVALGDFCMQPSTHFCTKLAGEHMDDVNYLNCGTVRDRFRSYLNESKDHIEHARSAFRDVIRVSSDLYPRLNMGEKTETIDGELNESREVLSDLIVMLERRSVERHYDNGLRAICDSGLLGLCLMTVATVATALLFTLLVCVDSHTWIYLTKRRKFVDKMETTPFLSTTTTTTMSPTAPIISGTATVNRTLLHHQQHGTLNGVATRNGTTLRGLAYKGGDSPPPDYNIVVHDNSRSSGHQTLGRLPSHHQSYLAGPNNGKYATLSKQCKTLESNDFY